ncbi:MAG TPA: PPC domain-containing protein, partial [Candidatus Polarisedimenticolia bacterium]|nr:PPC domain-containing protein [Candidatus Polarisedimenticolia bacterium]
MAVCSTFSILLLFPIRGRTQTLTNGALTTDTLLANRTNFYSFQGTNGDAILLRVGSALMNPSIVLRNPLGQVFASAGSGVSGVHDANIAVQSTNTGTFTVEVSSIFAGGAGAYNLNLARVPGDFVVLPGDDGGPITNGWINTGTNSLGDMDLWSLTANAGDSIVLRMGSATFNPWIRVYGPDGKEVATAGNGTSGFLTVDLATQATNSGTYVVVTSSFSVDGVGNYLLTLAKSPGTVFVAPGDEGGPMTNGWEHAGIISPGDLDVWTFNANAGDGIVLRMGSPAFNPWIRLFGPDGKEVATAGSGVSGFLNVDMTTQATNAGTYTVVVGSFSGNVTGSYVLNLAKPGAVFVAP